MVYLPGYKIIEQVVKRGNYTVLRAIRESDYNRVVIKLLSKDYPSAKEITDFIHEYQIMAKFDCEGIIKAYDFIKGKSYAIIMEEIEGWPLAEAIKNLKLSAGEKTLLAVKMADSLAQLHRQNVIHKNINLSNFVWNPETGSLKLIDFGNATELSVETPQFVNLNYLEGTLSYISPEQTGRINRPLDNRTDLYSLGVCLYELFTGRLPFQSADKSELIYCHIAKTPQPPHEVNPEVPVFLSEIIMKLMAKAAEERYQTAVGLKTDLEFCLNNFDALIFGYISFVPGQGDVSDRFEVPHRLYGREAEVEELINSFEKSSEGGAEILLLSGPSGIGKTSLIHEIYKPITARKGYFISGKFSQFTQSTPYHGFAQAFRELMRQLLAEPQERLDYFRQRLLHALGSNGQLIIDIIPELESIIGPHESVPDLNPREAQNRFKLAFSEFFKALTGPDSPLVIFLDDIQWSDSSTLDLLEYILEAGDIQYVFIIGAYRDNESEGILPRLHKMEKLAGGRSDRGIRLRWTCLKPLEFSAINQLVADTLRMGLEESKPLSKIIQRMTNGNPFFIRQMLNTLYRQKAFAFLPEKGCWTYDLEKVNAAEISDNVVDLLVISFESLPKGSKTLLSLASGIGNQFDLETISSISKLPPKKLAEDLWVAIEKEILLPLDSNYRYINTLKNETILKNLEMRFCFAHDRIRQAIYRVIPEKEKTKIHHKIGRMLLNSFRQTGRADIIFDLVNHLNKAKALIKSRDERFELADLNTLAGQKAMKSTAFFNALAYFEEAEKALSEKEWAAMPSKYFSLLTEQASAAMLSGGFEKAEALCGRLSLLAEGNLQKCSVSSVRALLYMFQGRLSDSIDELRRALRLLGFNLPKTDEEIDREIQEGIEKIRQFLDRNPVEEIVNLPIMIDPEKSMAMQLFFQLNPPAIQVSPKLFNLSAITMFNLTLAHGVTPLSCKAVCDCGAICGIAFSDFKTAYKLGEMAFALIDRFKAESQKAPVYFIFPFLSIWVKHYQESLDYYDMSYKAGLETGDLLHATYALANKVHYSFWAGKNLNECKDAAKSYISLIKQANMPAPRLLCEIVLYSIEKLMALPKRGDALEFEERDRTMRTLIEKSRNLVFLCRYYQYNAFISYILGNLDESEKWNALADKLLYAVSTDFPIPDHCLLKGLILAARWKNSPPPERSQIEDALSEILKQLEVWAENCPENYAHKYYLLSAEIAIIQDRPLETISGLYKKATDSIAADDFIQLKALINEQCGKFWLERGNEIVGKTYMREAYYLYGKWGADRKLALMDKEWDFRGQWAPMQEKSETLSEVASFVDMNSILKSTQAISGEIKIEKLLTTLMRILVENAGAQRGCILLKNEFDGKFYVEAFRDIESRQNQVVHSLPLYESKRLCIEIVNYVIRTREALVIQDASSDLILQNNPYIRENLIRSVMCIPVLYQNRLKGIVYLENNLSDNVFTAARLETIKILASQAAISIENAKLYENMEEKVRERTSQLNALNEKLRELSLRDSLTGTYNRRYLYGIVFEKVSAYLKEHSRPHEDEPGAFPPQANPIGVFLIDIDYFKEVNDTYGHAVGDSVLIRMSKVLKEMLHKDDVLVRWGGEEFLIILFNRSSEDYRRFAKRVVEEIENTPVKVSEDRVIYKTCSLGYCEIPLDSDVPELISLDQAIRISDYALYRAKEKGRNRSARFNLKGKGLNHEVLMNLNSLSKLDFNEKYFEIEYL